MGAVCKKCKNKVSKLVDGLCIECLTERAEKIHREALDMENDTPDIQINEPLSRSELIEVFSCRQPNRVNTSKDSDVLSIRNIRKNLGVAHSDKKWEAIKPFVDYMVNKYRKELTTGALKMMLVNENTMEYMATHESDKEIVEINNCIAVYR